MSHQCKPLRPRGDRYSISLPNATMRDEMALLGDEMIGTAPLLELRLRSDPTKPRKIGPDGNAECTIGRAEVLVGGRVMVEQKEQEIAWFLLLYGKWPMEDSPAEVVNGELISWGVRAAPEKRANPKENFEIVGRFSTMVSMQYNDITTSSGQVDILTPDRDPDTLGVLIPPDFKSDTLPLWRFVLKPTPPDPGSPG